MIIKYICIWFVLAVSIHAQVAAEFFEVQHYMQGDVLDKNNAINYIFNGTSLQNPDKNSVAIVHQNREWEYNWFVVAAVFQTNFGVIGTGYSNYSSPRLPVTKKNTVTEFISISEYSSDTFSMAWASFQPNMDIINLQFMGHIKHRSLHGQNASAYVFDVRVSSPKLLNNQIGIKTTNLVSTKYSWKKSDKINKIDETLPQYFGVYYIQPIGMVTVLVQHDTALNFVEFDTTMGHVFFEIDPMIHLMASYRATKHMTSLGFGANLYLTDAFLLNFMQTNEKTNVMDESVYTISIGVKY
jgi:hypothetical protein